LKLRFSLNAKKRNAAEPNSAAFFISLERREIATGIDNPQTQRQSLRQNHFNAVTQFKSLLLEADRAKGSNSPAASTVHLSCPFGIRIKSQYAGLLSSFLMISTSCPPYRTALVQQTFAALTA
jgi:hypothetical protein